MKKSLLLIFLSTILLEKPIFSQSGEQLFDESYVHTISIYIHQTNFWDTLSQRYLESIDKGPLPISALGNNPFLLSDSVKIDGVRIDRVGIKQKGYYSNWGAGNSIKKPLKISFDEFNAGEKFDGIKEINLSNCFQDPTMLHDALSYRMMREIGIAAPRTSYANVYFNDSIWGLYLMVEQINKTFLKDHFGDDSGNLYKVKQSDLSTSAGRPIDYKLQFEKKTNEKADDWDDLKLLIQKINSTSYFVYADTLRNYLNLAQFIKVLAMDVSLNNWDSYLDDGRNYFLYHNPSDHLFYWIPWDYNLAFSAQDYPIMLPTTRDRKPLIKKIFNNHELKAIYLDDLCNIQQQIFTLKKQESYIDSMLCKIATSVHRDPNYFYTFTQFVQSITTGIEDSVEVSPGLIEPRFTKGLKNYFADKNQFMTEELMNELDTCLVNTQRPLYPREAKFQIFPNPASDYLYFVGDLSINNRTKVLIYNDYNRLISKKFVMNGGIDIRTIPNGKYSIRVHVDHERLRYRLTIQH
jgi:CotH kinase protein